MSGPEQPKAVHPLSLSDWRRALPWLALLAAVYLGLNSFRPGGLAGKYIWDEHNVTHTYPLAWLAREEVREGFFPLWNPHSGAGLPLLANTLDETLLPHAALKYLLPFPLGVNLFLALKVMIALTGAFALGRRLGGSRPGAILGATLYTFTGLIALNANSVIDPVFVLPWCVFALYLLAEGPRFSIWLGVAAAFGLDLLGGNPEMVFLTLCLGYALYVFKLAVRRERFTLARWVAAPATAVIAGAMVALPQLLPFVQYLARAFSHHLPGFGLLHLDPRGLIGVGSPAWAPAIVLMVARDLGGLGVKIATRFPPASWADANIPMAYEHLGFGALFFLVFALVRLRRMRPEAWFFAAFALVNLGLSFGIFPFSLLAYVPPLNQTSTWRFTIFLAAIAVALLAAMNFEELSKPESRRQARLALALLTGLVSAAMAVLVSHAGLPLTSPLLTLPAAATFLALGLIAAVVLSRRPAAVTAVCFIELMAWDRLADRPLFVHPFEALKRPETWADCIRKNPRQRFLAYGDVLDPSLGVLVGRDDLRSYEMIFPNDQVRWYMALNRWDRPATVEWYMTHYYFAPEPRNLPLPETAKSALDTVMAEDPLPPSAFDARFFDAAAVLAPGPEFARPVKEAIGDDARRGVFLHAPSAVRVAALPAGAGVGRVAGAVAVGPDAWSRPGDGVTLQLYGGAGPGRLFYSRYLDPRAQPTERRWIDFTVNGLTAPLVAASLPGPRNDNRSDFGVIADLHDPDERAKFEETWEPSICGGTRCYHRRASLPRLRVAAAVRTVLSLDECLDIVRERSAPPAAELVVDGAAWPAGAGKVDEEEFGTNRVSARVKMDAPGTLVLADTYYPGWKAELDGREVPTRRANCTFRAVRVPAGAHAVAWVFKPEAFRIGLFAGMVSMLGMMVAAMAWRKH